MQRSFPDDIITQKGRICAMPEERIKPPEEGTTVEYEEHIARYRFAEGFVRQDADGLDIACGTGYGTALLAKRSSSFHGVDISAEAIGYSQGHFKDKPLSFICSDALKADFKKDSFDIITSFETIEHLREGAGDLFLQRLQGFLRKSGILIISCPNKDTYPEGYNKNEFHIHEYSYDEIRALLSKYFTITATYCQEMRYFKRKYKKIAQFLSHMPEGFIRFLVNISRRSYEKDGLKSMNVLMRILLYESYFKYAVYEFVEDYHFFKPVSFVFVCNK